MRREVCLLLALVALLLTSGARTIRDRAEGARGLGSFQKGMVLGIFSKTDPEYFRQNLDEMQNLGVDSVSLIVPKVQKDVSSIGFYDDPWITPSDESLRLAIREAHRRGMRVFLLPIVYLEVLKEGEWRGTLAPGDWDAWFRTYEAMITHYARMAGEERVEYFSAGSELCSTEKMRERWERVIRKIRSVYPGPITYSANWDHLNHMAMGQFYHVAVCSKKPYWVYGGLQDNGCWGGPSVGLRGIGPIKEDSERLPGSDHLLCQLGPPQSGLLR